jgi:hypothetical protein
MAHRDLVLFPYLRLDKRMRVGPWELIPKNDLREDDVIDKSVFDLVLKHLGVYALPDTLKDAAARCGCFARPESGKLGQEIDRSTLLALRLSVLPALLVMNPMPNTLNPGLTLSTSDNATLYGHPFNEEGRIVFEYGSIIRTQIAGVRVGESPSHVYHPAELHLPLMPIHPDTELAEGLHACLTRPTDEARRLGTAIEWLDIAWRNTTSITQEVRVMALKSGLEVLLNVGMGVEAGRDAFSLLLDSPNAPKSPRTYPDRGESTKTHTRLLTDRAWWFTKFAFLRNAIAHGHEVPEDDWIFNERSQVTLGQVQLLDAIRKKVADATGDAALMEVPADRLIDRAIKEWAERHPNHGGR